MLMCLSFLFSISAKLGEGFTLPDLPDEIHLVHHSLHLNNVSI